VSTHRTRSHQHPFTTTTPPNANNSANGTRKNTALASTLSPPSPTSIESTLLPEVDVDGISLTGGGARNGEYDGMAPSPSPVAVRGGFFKPEAVRDWLWAKDDGQSPFVRHDVSLRGGSSISTSAESLFDGNASDISLLGTRVIVSAGTEKTVVVEEHFTDDAVNGRTTSGVTSAPSKPMTASSTTSKTTKTTYPVSTHSIQGKRPYMEDEYYTNHNGSFVAIMDGHGGNAVSKYLRQNLYARYLQAKDTATTTDPPQSTVKSRKQALTSAFHTIDAEVQRISHWSYQGSTAVAALFHRVHLPPTDQSPTTLSRTVTYLITANVGDSRAVISRSRQAIDATTDHKPDVPAERERIERLGGTVDWCGPVEPGTGVPIVKRRAGGGRVRGVYRINGNLALSRAIGDRSEHPCVSSEVDVREFELVDGEDEFVLLGSDGLWDVFETSQEVVDFCYRALDNGGEEGVEGVRKQLAEIVVQEALRRGSMDNISASIIWLV